MIDYTCGVVLEKKIGDKVNKGETLAHIHSNKQELINEAEIKIKEAYKIEDKEPEKYKHILNVI